jgi:hypothetical protein
MKAKANDIRNELRARIAEAQKEIGVLQIDRTKIDEKLKDAEKRLNALRVVYAIEAERLGEVKTPLFTEKGAPSRFTGMKLIDALAILKKEQPNITKKQAHDILVKEGFAFRSDRTLNAVHFAWIGLERSEKKRSKS